MIMNKASGDVVIEKIDEFITKLVSPWDIWTIILALVVAALIIYPWLSAEPPDTHPLLLARQANVSRTRKEGESAIYRSQEILHAQTLTSGLDIKDPGVSKWVSGRDGDLCDVWRHAAKEHGQVGGLTMEKPACIFTVLGKEEVIEHSIEDLSYEINAMGQCLQRHGSKRVAIYLPNSVELLTTIFASAFYGLTPIILPFNQSSTTLVRQLQMTKPDSLIAGAGSVPLSELVHGYPALMQIIWVVDKGSQHMDWNEVPEGIGGKFGVSVWQDIIDDKKAEVGKDLPSIEKGPVLEGVVFIWQSKHDEVGEAVQFSQRNLVSAIASQISTISRKSLRFGPSDLFLPVDSLSSIYPLVLTLAALYSHASIALNSVAGPGVDLTLATRNVAPTIVVMSPETALRAHSKTIAQMKNLGYKAVHAIQTRTLSEGRMPESTPISRISNHLRPIIGDVPGKLRLLYIPQRVHTESPPVTSQELSDLRIFTGARVIYALSASKVAGAVCQTKIFDYRTVSPSEQKNSHFGGPLSCLELRLVDTPSHRTLDGRDPEGELVATGPAVVGGEANLGLLATFRGDGTLAYV